MEPPRAEHPEVGRDTVSGMDTKVIWLAVAVLCLAAGVLLPSDGFDDAPKALAVAAAGAGGGALGQAWRHRHPR